MDDVVRIVGLKVAESKKYTGTRYYTYYFESVHSEYDVQNAVVLEGCATGSEFSKVDLGCHPGDEVIFSYRKGFDGKAELYSCQIVGSSAKSGK